MQYSFWGPPSVAVRAAPKGRTAPSEPWLRQRGIALGVLRASEPPVAEDDAPLREEQLGPQVGNWIALRHLTVGMPSTAYFREFGGVREEEVAHMADLPERLPGQLAACAIWHLPVTASGIDPLVFLAYRARHAGRRPAVPLVVGWRPYATSDLLPWRQLKRQLAEAEGINDRPPSQEDEEEEEMEETDDEAQADPDDESQWAGAAPWLQDAKLLPQLDARTLRLERLWLAEWLGEPHAAPLIVLRPDGAVVLGSGLPPRLRAMLSALPIHPWLSADDLAARFPQDRRPSAVEISRALAHLEARGLLIPAPREMAQWYRSRHPGIGRRPLRVYASVVAHVEWLVWYRAWRDELHDSDAHPGYELESPIATRHAPSDFSGEAAEVLDADAAAARIRRLHERLRRSGALSL